jgi:hypothetical protein
MKVNDFDSLIASMNDLITPENKKTLVTRILTLSSYGDSSNTGPLGSIDEMYLNHIIDQDLFDRISDNDQAGLLMEKTTVGVKDSSGDDQKIIGRLESFLQFTGYLRDQRAVGMITNLQSGMTLFMKPSEHCRAQMYSLSTQYLKMWCLVTAERIAKESEAARISAMVHAKAARIAALVESARIAAEVEAARIAAEVEAARIAAKVEEARITARIAAVLSRRHESASTRRPVEQSYKCKEAERQRFEFWLRMFVKYSFTYLQGNTADGPPTADESPPPQVLPAKVAELLGDALRFYAAHYPPKSQGKKKYTDPRTGGPTCTTNEIIYDAIYASLPHDCKLTFAQMFDNFDDLCPFKAPCMSRA